MNTSVEVWENQRWLPGKGWGTHRLPMDRSSWSDRSGKRELSKAGCLLPHGWRWTSTWTIRSPSPKSEEGWLYAVDYTVPTRMCSIKAGLTSCVRRRCWVRSRSLEGPPGEAKAPPKELSTLSLDDDDARHDQDDDEAAAAAAAGDDSAAADFVDDTACLPRCLEEPRNDKSVGSPLTSSRYFATHASHPREVMHYGFTGAAATAHRQAAYEARQHRGVSVFLPLVTAYFERHVGANSNDHESVGSRMPHLSLNNGQLKELYEVGIPQGLRATMWMALSGCFERKKCGTGHYAELVAAINPEVFWSPKHEINVDVVRTYPSHPSFANGFGTMSTALRRILFALVAHAQIGYQQAFSYIGALLLMNVDTEEDAFWLMVALVCPGGVLPDGYFTDHKVDADLRVVRELTDAHVDRRLARHMSAYGLDVSLFANGWMQALLTAHVPPPTACRILDVIFAEWSNGVVVRFVVAFLSLTQEHIMTVDDLGSLGQFANAWARNLWGADSVMAIVCADGLSKAVSSIRDRALADAEAEANAIEGRSSSPSPKREP